MVKNYKKLHTFITRLVKEIDPKIVITAECKDILNHLIRDVALEYITASVEMCRYATKVTIDSRAIIALTHIWINEPASIVEFAHDRWDAYSANKVRGLSKHKRAGLSLPPARFRELFQQFRGANQKIGEPAYLFLAAVLEAMFTMIIKRAIELTRLEDRVTIRGVHIYQALRSEDLKFLQPFFSHTFIAGFSP